MSDEIEIVGEAVEFGYEANESLKPQIVVNEVVELMAKAFLLAVDEDKGVDVDLLVEICESVVEKEEIEIVELLKEAIGEPDL